MSAPTCHVCQKHNVKSMCEEGRRKRGKRVNDRSKERGESRCIMGRIVNRIRQHDGVGIRRSKS